MPVRVITFVITIIILFLSNLGFCQKSTEPTLSHNPTISNTQNIEKVNVQSRIIGIIFKTFTKTLILTTDIDKLRRDNIDKINKMDEATFHARYMDFLWTLI